MRRAFAFILVVGLVLCGAAETQVINGVTYECKDGVCRMVTPMTVPATAQSVDKTLPAPTRLVEGLLDADGLVAFITGSEAANANPFAGRGLWLVLLLTLLGGLALNLTPCVLPMIPINLMVIGRSALRGSLFGLGMMLGYGGLGVAAAVFGLGFGEIQSSPWFNVVIALVFVALALALLGVFGIDFSSHRRRVSGTLGLLGVVGLGLMGALLAGACVAPLLVANLVLTADLFAKGNVAALALPFVLGLGLALPWPFLGAGFQVLPRPGAWMRWTNRVLAVFVLLLAAHYARLAVRGFAQVPVDADEVTPATFAARLAAARRPVFVDCTASWCKNCAAAKRLIERSPDVRKALEGHTVIVLRAEDLRELRTLHGFETVRGLPAFAIYE